MATKITASDEPQKLDSEFSISSPKIPTDSQMVSQPIFEFLCFTFSSDFHPIIE